jgi:hypothetical protein
MGNLKQYATCANHISSSSSSTSRYAITTQHHLHLPMSLCSIGLYFEIFWAVLGSLCKMFVPILLFCWMLSPKLKNFNFSRILTLRSWSLGVYVATYRKKLTSAVSTALFMAQHSHPYISLSTSGYHYVSSYDYYIIYVTRNFHYQFLYQAPVNSDLTLHTHWFASAFHSWGHGSNPTRSLGVFRHVRVLCCLLFNSKE